jgi:hypothetical protein
MTSQIKILNANIFQLFILICFLFLFFHISIDYLYFTNDIVFAPYLDVYSETRITNLIELRDKWYWVSHLIFPIFFAIECFFISLIIYLGTYLMGKNFDYLKVFKISVVAQIVFVFPEILKLFWFSYYPVTLDALREFHPLSLFSLFDPELLQEWLYYPFRVLNLFEVGYWLLLAYLLAKHLNQTFDEMLKLVLTYYVRFLFCWIIFVMFISLGNS